MSCRYILAMLFALLSLTIAAAPASAQVRATATTATIGSATVTATVTATATATATASVTILARPVRIIAADLSRADGARTLPPQSTLSTRPCDAGAPRGCQMIVVDLP